MALQNSFDLAKKQAEGASLSSGYTMEDGRFYNAYLTNQEWDSFRSEMEKDYPIAFQNYKDGDGGEIEEKQYPPKMASYGSSSRFIYKLSRDIPGFEFEKKLGICVPARNENTEAKASLDGYLESKTIFVEAKCREIYSESHPEFNEKYRAFYNFLSEGTGSDFQFELKESVNKMGEIKRRIYFSWAGKPISHLDLKQLLCHMLGIGKKSLIEGGKNTPTLLYLVYRPTDKVLSFINSKRTVNSIKRCREIEENEASSIIDTKLLYKLAVRFLHEVKNVNASLSPEEVERISNNFVFRFCDQEEYSQILR